MAPTTVTTISDSQHNSKLHKERFYIKITETGTNKNNVFVRRKTFQVNMIFKTIFLPMEYTNKIFNKSTVVYVTPK